MNIIDINTEKNILASCLPDGQFWSNKNNIQSKLGSFIFSLAKIYNQYRYYVDDEQKELIVFRCTKYLELWEQLLGLPDGIFTKTTELSFENRLKQILIKLIGLGSYTKPQVLNLLQILYPQITKIIIKSGRERASFPIMFPIPFFESVMQATRYCYVDIYGITPVNTFPLPFPIPFNFDDTALISTILNIIKPHNIKLIINYYP